MGKPTPFQPARPSQLPAREPLRNQAQPRPTIQPKVSAPPQGPKPPVAPPAYRPQPTPQALQRKAAVGVQPAGAPARPAAPPVFRPQPAPKVLQPKGSTPQSPQAGQAPRQAVRPQGGVRSTVVQMVECTCGKRGNNKHKSNCPRNKNNIRATNEVQQDNHQESQSLMNIYAYDTVWAKANNIDESHIKAFKKEYGKEMGKIHGHASSRADTDAKRHANTTRDINNFHRFYAAKYS